MRIRTASFLLATLAAYGLSFLPIRQAAAQTDHRGLRVQQGERRVALVIGNSAYKDSPLLNPVNDARGMAAALRGLGFEVVFGENLSQADMKRSIRAFGEKIRNGGVGLFYYAGHGAQVKGSNYLIPVGSTITSEEEVEYESVDVGLVLAQMESAHNRLNIVILDACRNNPFARSFRSTQKGLASIDAPAGTLIAYATAPGSVASDGSGGNGLYTQELLKYMKQPGLSIEQLFKQVRASVRSRSEGKQTPWESSSLVGDFYFSGSSGAAPSIKPPAVSRLLNALGNSNTEVIDTLTLGRNLYVLYAEELNSGRWEQNPDGVKFLRCDLYVAKIDVQMDLKTVKLSTIYGFNTSTDRTNIGIARTHGAIDADADGIIVFVIEKKGSKDYAMTGYLYKLSANDLAMNKSETLFPYSNMGWYPVIKNGVVTHFSYAGFCLFRGDQQMERYSPDDALHAYSTYKFKKIGAGKDRSVDEYTRMAIDYISQWQ